MAAGVRQGGKTAENAGVKREPHGQPEPDKSCRGGFKKPGKSSGRRYTYKWLQLFAVDV